MLKLVELSQAKKTTGCAVTYRAGAKSCFGTCPSSCSLNPQPRASVQTIDRRYLDALLAAVPREGTAFTFTHFNPVQWSQPFLDHLGSGKPTTTVNFSTESAAEAITAYHRWLPVVMALPKGSERKVAHLGRIRVIRCPAEYTEGLSCRDCGGGRPLCARPHRNYIIGFYAHGPMAKHVSRPTLGGCYASSGNVRLHWDKTVGSCRSEPSQLAQWTKDLPRGTVLRHHVAGDIGAEEDYGIEGEDL